MIYRTSPEQIKSYFESKDHLSQSFLKIYISGYDYYIEALAKNDEESANYFDEEKEHFIIGSAVDMKLTQAPEEFEKKYHISTLTVKPSATEISIIKMVFDEAIKECVDNDLTPTPTLVGNILDYDALLTKAFEFHTYQPRYGFDAKKKAFDNVKVSEYWTELLNSIGKQILTLEDHVLINSLVETLKTSSATSFMFSENERNVDIFYQVPIYRELTEAKIPCKGLIDVLVIDYDYGLISIYDIKTMNNSVIDFPLDFKRRKYDVQAGFYSLLFNHDSIIDTLTQLYPDFPVENANTTSTFIINASFNFAVVSKRFPSSSAVMYVLIPEKIREIINGRPECNSHGMSIEGEMIPFTHKEIIGVKKHIMNFAGSQILNREVRTLNGIIL